MSYSEPKWLQCLKDSLARERELEQANQELQRQLASAGNGAAASSRETNECQLALQSCQTAERQLRDELSRAVEETSQQRATLAELQVRLQAATEAATGAQDAQRECRRELQALQNRAGQLEASAGANDDRERATRQQLNVVNGEVLALRERVQELDEELKITNALQSNPNQAQQEEDYAARLQDLQRQCEKRERQLQAEQMRLNETLIETQRERQSIAADLDSLELRHQTVNDTLSRVTEQHQVLLQLEQRLRADGVACRTGLQACDDGRRQLQVQVDALRIENQDLSSRAAQHRQDMRRAQDDRVRLEGLLAQPEQQQGQVSERAKWQKQLDKLNETIVQQRHQADASKAEFDDLYARYKEARATAARFRDRAARVEQVAADQGIDIDQALASS